MNPWNVICTAGGTHGRRSAAEISIPVIFLLFRAVCAANRELLERSLQAVRVIPGS